jgi:hypothetical protein
MPDITTQAGQGRLSSDPTSFPYSYISKSQTFAPCTSGTVPGYQTVCSKTPDFPHRGASRLQTGSTGPNSTSPSLFALPHTLPLSLAPAVPGAYLPPQVSCAAQRFMAPQVQVKGPALPQWRMQEPRGTTSLGAGLAASGLQGAVKNQERGDSQLPRKTPSTKRVRSARMQYCIFGNKKSHKRAVHFSCCTVCGQDTKYGHACVDAHLVSGLETCDFYYNQLYAWLSIQLTTCMHTPGFGNLFI